MKSGKLPSVTNLLFPHSVDELFHQFWNGNEPNSPAKSGWLPSVDVKEVDDAYVITAELPGVDAADVDLTVTAEGLTLKGEKKSESESDEGNRHVTERVYGAFSRRITFPVPVATEDVKAEARQGILTITVKKAEAQKTRRIEIQSD